MHALSGPATPQKLEAASRHALLYGYGNFDASIDSSDGTDSLMAEAHMAGVVAGAAPQSLPLRTALLQQPSNPFPRG